MEIQMKSKLLEKISNVQSEISSLEDQLNEKLKSESMTRETQLQLGAATLRMQNLVNTLFAYIEVFIDVLRGTIEELPEKSQQLYNQVQELQKPPSESDSEDIKKIKELISKSKQNGI